MEYLNGQTNNIKPKRRKARTRSKCGSDGLGREGRIAKRNRVLVARWYYWTEYKRLRTDDAIATLCDEFFVEQRTVTNVLIKEDAYFCTLLNAKTSVRELSKEYSSFNWS